MDGTSGCFPMEAHIAYAKKIARAVIHDNTFDGEKVDLFTKNLSESEVADLDSYFSTAAFDIKGSNLSRSNSGSRCHNQREDLISIENFS